MVAKDIIGLESLTIRLVLKSVVNGLKEVERKLMTNSNYLKGRKKEYKLKKEYQDKGYLVLRSAGSHGFADLVAINDKEIIFIQCKPKHFSETKRQELLDKYSWIKNTFQASFIVI